MSNWEHLHDPSCVHKHSPPRYYDGCTCQVVSMGNYRAVIQERDALAARCAELEALVRMGADVVNDFLPNISRCVLQRYDRMNMFLVEAGKLPTSEKSDE